MTTAKPWLVPALLVLLGSGLAVTMRAQAGSDNRLPNCVANAKWSSTPIDGADLWKSGGPGGAFVAAKTNAGNFSLMSLSALNTLVIESSDLYDAKGTVLSKQEYMNVPAGTAFDLDKAAAATDSTADIKWNSGPGGKNLEPVNNAQVYTCTASDRQITPK